MKRVNHRRTLSLFLVIVLMASLFGMTVQAVDNGETTTEPTTIPSIQTSADPSAEPSADPSAEPSADPSAEPSTDPSAEPSADPSAEPYTDPGAEPSTNPSAKPSEDSSAEQSKAQAIKSSAPELTQQNLSVEMSDGVIIAVSGCLPAGIKLHAEKKSNLGLGYADFFYAYDISLWLGDKEYYITDTVSVSIIGLALPKEDICTFILQGEAVNKLNFESCDKTITFYTGCLSTFVVTLKSFDWKGCILGPNTVAVNDKISLFSTSKIATKDHSWSSDDTSIADVIWSCENKAVIKGVSEGTVAITHTFKYWSGFLCFGSWKTACETVDITVYSHALTITKTFTGLTAEEISSLDNFAITVKDACPLKCPSIYTMKLSDATVDNDGMYTWVLTDIKPGDYIVSESGFEVAGYSVVSHVNSKTTGTSANVTVSKCSDAKVAFINTYTPIPTPTGTLTVTKTFSGNGGNIPKDFAIVVNGTSYPLGEPTTNGVYTWEITLPLGEEYSVSETNTDINGYTLDTSSITSASGTLTVEGALAELKNVYTQNPGRVVTVRYEYKDPVPSGAKLPNDGNPITVPYNSAYTSVQPATVTGYIFDGWYVKNTEEIPTATVSSFFVKLFGGDVKYVDGTKLTSDIVLYGYWIKTYSVTYTWSGSAPSDVSSLPATKSYKEGEEVKIAPTPTTSQAYWTFSGWKINGNPASDFEMGKSDVTIVGSWTQTIVYPPGIIDPQIPITTQIPEESPPLNPSPSISPDPGADIPEEEVPHADAPVIPVDNNKPQTGDNSNLPLMVILATLSAIGIVAVSFVGKRKKSGR